MSEKSFAIFSVAAAIAWGVVLYPPPPSFSAAPAVPAPSGPDVRLCAQAQGGIRTLATPEAANVHHDCEGKPSAA